AQFVQQHERLRIRRAQYADDIFQMPGKGRERLLDRLFVADVGKDAGIEWQTRTFRRRNVQTTLRHQREQTDCFERNRFAAGIRSCDDENGKGALQFKRDRNYSVRVEQWVARLFQFQKRGLLARADINDRRNGALFGGILGFGEREVQLRQCLDGILDRVG